MINGSIFGDKSNTVVSTSGSDYTHMFHESFGSGEFFGFLVRVFDES